MLGVIFCIYFLGFTKLCRGCLYLGCTRGYAFRGKEHGLVGNGHTIFLPMQSVSHDKGEGGGIQD